MAAILSLLAAASFGIGDFLGGVGSRQIPAKAVAAITSLAGLIVALPILIVIGGRWSNGAIVFGAAAGLLGALGLVMLFIGLVMAPPAVWILAGGSTSFPTSIERMPLLSGVFLGERLRRLQLVGFVLAMGAGLLLAV